ncbi:hypothetical protein [Paenibacillus konkukensis]|nr:hypothetical protein [Paenibacillus konkukensis]
MSISSTPANGTIGIPSWTASYSEAAELATARIRNKPAYYFALAA